MLLRRLGQSTDPDAYHVLAKLASCAASGAEGALLVRLSRDVARRVAQREPWTARQFAEYDEQRRLSPRTTSQLFDVVARRLEQFKDETERHNFAGAKAFAPEPDEADVQRHLALWLESHSNGDFNVDRELHVIDEKRVDIRILRTDVSGIIAIEIKRAEAWTLRELGDRIEGQLVELYMKPHTSRHGFFFVTKMSDDPHWMDSSGN